MWPSAKRAPLKDLFHGMKKATESTRKQHELGPVFAKSLSRASLGHDKQSISHVLTLFKRKEKVSGDSNVVLQREMLSMKKYKRKIRNFVRKKDEHAEEVLKSFSAIVEQDKLTREQTDTFDCHCKSLILK